MRGVKPKVSGKGRNLKVGKKEVGRASIREAMAHIVKIEQQIERLNEKLNEMNYVDEDECD